MKSFSERIALVLEHYQLQPKDLAEKCGVQRSAISHLINGRNRPSVRFLSTLSDIYPEIDTRWLLHGKGEMFTSVAQLNVKTADTNVSPINQSSLRERSPVTNVDSTPTGPVQSVPDTADEKRKEVPSDTREKQIQRIIVFYNDGTFDSYNPQGD